LATEDYTTYTEYDPNGVLTVTSSEITAEDMDRDIDAYVYLDKGVGHFGDFEHKLTVMGKGTSQAYAVGHMWILSNDIDDGNNANGLHLLMNEGSSYGKDWKIILGEGTGFCSDNRDDYADDCNDTYRYLTIKRAGTTLTCKIYSDEARTNLLDTLSLTVATTTYQYIYAIASHNSGSSACNFDGMVKDLDLQETTPPATGYLNCMSKYWNS